MLLSLLLFSVLTRDLVADASPTLGDFPIKAALMYHHFAKLYLFSHVFRGLANNDPIPGPLREAASGAVAAAIDIIELFLTDPDIGDGLKGMPTYLHAMTCFSCVFLLKIAAKRHDDGLVEVGSVADMAARLVRQFRGVQVAKWHLAHLVADGLEKSAASLLGGRGVGVDGGYPSAAGDVGAAAMDAGLDDASRAPFGLYMDPSTSVSHGSVGSTLGAFGSAGGILPAPGSLESPDLNFGPQGYFDFNAAQSGIGDDP